MSETAPETTRTTQSPFLRKLGPLPLWGWMGVVLAVVLVYYFWKQKSSSASTATTASTDTGAAASGDIPQFVNQTYVQATPPSAPNVTPSSPTVPAAAAPAQPSPLPVTVVPPKSMRNSVTTANSAWTLEDLAKFEKVTNPVAAFGGANQIAKTFLTVTYPKNHQAKIPKGAQFTWVTGT